MNIQQNGNVKPDTGIPTVSRVANDTLIELVYDPVNRKTGLAVSRHGGLWNIEQEVRIHTGETLIPYSPKNNLIANDCVLLPSKPEHHGDKAELLADIATFLHRYVDLSPLFEQIAAHYMAARCRTSGSATSYVKILGSPLANQRASTSCLCLKNPRSKRFPHGILDNCTQLSVMPLEIPKHREPAV